MARQFSEKEKEDRLSAQLRANLAKRKGQLRARNQVEVPEAPSAPCAPDSPADSPKNR